MKSGFIAIVGRPNVGKSTLLNAILGEKIAIVSDKPQTTRNTIRGIYTKEDLQMVFLDTPGIHKPRNKLGNYMVNAAVNTFNDTEAIVYIVDDRLSKGPGDKYIVDILKDVKTPKILVINKIDKMTPDEYKAIYDEYEELGIFREIIGISAKENHNVDTLVRTLEELLPEGPFFFPEDMVTDHPERFIVSEIIREKMLMYLNDELPHGVAVEIERFEDEGTLVKIGAVIYCEKKSHKGMIIGKQGRKLKGIGKSARQDIEALLGVKVFLELWVKVKENWRDSDIMLSNFGYKDE
ncbi:MAG: GTPase Era [Firmicutes bacterium]|nr:GTPase Era [Bacillota bacterium]